MRLYKNLPIYKIEISDEYDTDDELGMTCVSFVDDPAVSSDFLTFNKEDEKKKMMFVKPEEGIITGVAIRANYPIYRWDEKGGYYVVFTKEQIKKIVEKYSKNQRFNNTSLQHNGTPLQNVYLVEMYIKDWSRGINPKEFEHIEDGSLFMSYKIDDMDLWNQIKTSGNINGFSIEIMSYLNIIDTDADEFSAEDELEKFVNDAVAEDKKKIDFVSEQKIKKYINNDNLVLIKTYDYPDGRLCQIEKIDKLNGNWNAVYYEQNDDGGYWQLRPIDEITDIEVTNTKRDSWGELKRLPSYKAINEILDDTITPKTKLDVKTIDEAIESGAYCIINYNDTKPEPHIGARQSVILARGNIKGGTRGECIRIYQKYGDSRSKHQPYYRLLLTSRIINIRFLNDMEVCDDNELDSYGYYVWREDHCMQPCIKWRTRGMVK